MAFISANETTLRKNAAEASVASVRLEGLEPSLQLIRELAEWAAGDRTLDEVRDRTFARFAQEDRDAGR